MSPETLSILAAAGLAIGLAVGCTGIGGVLLVPFLAYALGLPVQNAVAATLWSSLWSGIVAVWLFARRGSIRWSMTPWLCVAAMPSAYLGARATAVIPSRWLEVLVAGLVMASGINALRRPPADAPPRHLGGGALAGLGALTGFGAALVGAGGALVLVPMLVALDQPVLLAVGLGQVVQLPIAVLASLANLAGGRVDLAVGTVLAATLSLGIPLGAWLAHALAQRTLQRLLALSMTAVGVFLLARLVLVSAA